MSDEKQQFTATAGKAEFARILNLVEHGGARVTILRHHRPAAIVIPIKEFQSLQKLKEKARQQRKG